MRQTDSMQFLNEDGAVFNSAFLYAADTDMSPHPPLSSSLGGHVARSFAPTTPDASLHLNRSAAARTRSSSRPKDTLPELASAFSRRRTPQQFSPILDDLPAPLEATRGASRHSYEPDAMFAATSPSISSSAGKLNRDAREQQQVLRRTRQELCVPPPAPPDEIVAGCV